MIANEEGRFRIRLAQGEYSLRFSHIAHYSRSVDIAVSDSSATLNVRLHPSVLILKGLKVYERAYDPVLGQLVIKNRQNP